MDIRAIRYNFLFIFILAVFLSSLLWSAHGCSAAVSRQLEIDMDDVTRFQLVKTRTYSNNEVGVIRTQLDKDTRFGNEDGYLDENEVNAFLASYNDHFEESIWIVMDESTVIKQNATVTVFNLAGSPLDTDSNITTIFTFDARPVSIPQQREHFIKFNRELWKYNDLDGIARDTVDNNLTISAPQGWRIVYTAGLHNETYEEDRRIMHSNANLAFEWINVKISREVEADENDGDDPLLPENVRNILIFMVIAAVIATLILVKVYNSRKTRTPAEPITEAKREELVSEKRKVQDEIIAVRRDLRDDVITKEEAKVREKSLKERLREIEGMLSAVKIDKVKEKT